MLKILYGKLAELRSELVYKLAISKHRVHLPKLDLQERQIYGRSDIPTERRSDRAILETLKTEGVCITSLDELGLKSSASLLEAAYTQLSAMAAPKHSSKGQKLPQIYTLTDFAEFSNWGNENRLLNIVENYIGLPIRFQGIHLRKDFPNEDQFGTLLWHKDSEDRRMVKVIIYLSDVEEKHGPFEYVPLPLNRINTLNYYRVYYQLWRSRYIGIDDQTLEKIIPQSAWKSCPGKAGTVILVDAKCVLHHGTLRTEERSTLFFVYTANPPKRPELCTQYWDDTFTKPKPVGSLTSVS
ncbi:hypothetical protein [Calothrix sp. PCC 6303]|uniref:hypothetical protein n=1 Tax=Calothrix sp. PCC 6303 TaxID=1170562 RepID=UPI0002A040EE|nr:hypothetical protein [Calothrix sp. PCC 6303]AFZ00857.1 hypothetical protein Cal6303_1821 [Calothrix sp. PCC 6303]